MTQKLIVNADDYGHTAGVSEGIRRAHLQGIVTSTTAMMNRPAAVSELPKAQSLCPRLGLGMHLVLTTGVPVLPVNRVPSLVDAEGHFHHREPFIQRLNMLNLDEVEAEWHAQVDLFVRTTGRSPDHLDSHHHSSYFTPTLFERMLHLADELHCPIRSPFADVAAPPSDYLPGGQPEADLAASQELFARYHPITPQRFMSDFYDEGISLAHLEALLRQVAAGKTLLTWELMCHPAVVDDELRRISDYSDMRGEELTVLTDPSLHTLLRSLQIELVTF
jgi:predicted glycoside hydrolase/deacetylase ChbG (UPF0249 family)